MNFYLHIFFVTSLTLFFSMSICSCLRSENSATETVVNSADGTNIEITARCEFAETDLIQHSVESDNQTQKAFR